jgi:hypothetical protein
MTLRRICTIAGRAYTLTGHCAKCGDPMWVTLDAPTQQAGCTDTACRQRDTPPVSPSRRRQPDDTPPVVEPRFPGFTS